MPTLKLDSICLDIENYNILDNISFEIDGGEITAIIGTGGCGKSSLLRCIAGNVRPWSGEVHFDETDVTRISPLKRKAFLVGDWEIAPRTKVVDAIAVVARQWGVPSKERAQQVDEAMIAMKLLHLSERRIRSISTSERRRIYLAAALAAQPKWILADNPLAYMETALKEEILENLVDLCRRKNMGLIWATTSKEEAFTIADKLVVMDKGKVLQVDHPRRVQQYPASAKVAATVSAANLIEGDLIQEAAGMALVKTAVGEFSGMLTCDRETYKEDKSVHVCLRPESIQILQMPADENCFTGKIVMATNKGASALYTVALENGEQIRILEQNPRFLDAGEESLYFWIAPDDIAVTP